MPNPSTNSDANRVGVKRATSASLEVGAVPAFALVADPFRHLEPLAVNPIKHEDANSGHSAIHEPCPLLRASDSLLVRFPSRVERRDKTPVTSTLNNKRINVSKAAASRMDKDEEKSTRRPWTASLVMVPTRSTPASIESRKRLFETMIAECDKDEYGKSI